MQCENAYLKPGVRYILCKKAKEPGNNDMRAQAHALCGHQRFCPNARACSLLPGWEKCMKRDANAPQMREEAAESIAEEKPKKNTRKKKAKEKEI